MIISDKHKYIFIGIPKTATLSIRRVLSVLEGEDLSAHKLYLPPGHRETVNHATALQIRKLNPDIWEQYFKFVFVRNPWDRAVSWHAYINKLEPLTARQKLLLPFNFNLKRKIKHEFTHWLLHDYHNAVLKGIVALHYQYDKEEKKVSVNELKDYEIDSLLPSFDWIADESGKVIVDFVGRYENLESDFKKICKILGVDLKLPHCNQTHRLDYHHYYTKKTRNTVEQRFKKDIEAFGYEF